MDNVRRGLIWSACVLVATLVTSANGLAESTKPKPTKSAAAAKESDWAEVEARKISILSDCTEGKVPCDLTTLRIALQRMEERDVDGLLGPPSNKQLVGGKSLSYWSVRINDAGRTRSVRVQIEWGYGCKDRTMPSGTGAHACEVNLY